MQTRHGISLVARAQASLRIRGCSWPSAHTEAPHTTCPGTPLVSSLHLATVQAAGNHAVLEPHRPAFPQLDSRAPPS